MSAENPTQIGFGTTISYGNGATPEVFTPVLTNIFEVTPPEIKVDTVESTHMQSPGGYKQRIPALADVGELSFMGAFSAGDAGVQAIRALIGKQQNWQVRFPPPAGAASPAAEAWTVNAILSAFKPVTPLDDKMTYQVTLTPSGPPTFSAVA